MEQGLPVHKLAHLMASESRHKQGKPVIDRPTAAAYLFRATVERVIDGDTMDLRIDLGFEVDRRGRFRLANVNSPELPSAEARAARDFVFARLRDAKTIVVKTERTDLHGRYVAHLFYSTADTSIDHCFKEGVYLNEDLVAECHADIVPM